MLVGAARDGTIDTWSAGAAALYGWTADEAVGQPLSLLAPPDRVQELVGRLRLYDGRALPAFETVRRHQDGTDVPVEVHVVPVRDAAGEVVGTLALHRDLRRAREAEDALEASQDELRAHFADSSVPQARVAMDGQVLAANAAMEELLGVGPGELAGRDALIGHLVGDRADLVSRLRDLADGIVSYVRGDRTLRTADGRLVPVVVTVTVVHGARGDRSLAVSAEDVTALREAEQRLRTQAARYEALLETMPVVVFVYDRTGVCTSSRGSALAHFGLEQDESVGQCLLDLYADHPHVVAAIRQTLTGRPSRSSMDAGGRVWEAHYRPLLGVDGRVEGGIGIAVDVTAQAVAEREVAANEARLAALLRHASDVALVVDLSGRIVYASASAGSQLGYAEADLFWTQAASYNHPDDRNVVAAAWRSVLRDAGATVRVECRVRHADGSWRWADHVLTNLVADPAVGGVVMNIRESTGRRRAEEELRQLAVRDALTGLPNRALLLDRVDRALASGRRTGAATGLVLLDVVGMSSVNERLGHAGGDALLKEVAARLQAVLRPTDALARVGGDAFAVLAEDVASEEDLRARASAISAAAEEPFEVDGQVLRVGLQLGTALSPSVDAGALLAAAERAAASRRASHVVVASPLHDAGAEDLRRALREHELVLHFQPVVDLRTGTATGVEALVRWQHPERGLLLPGDFVPLAERSGLVVDLGAWAVRRVVAQLAAWADRDLAIGLNLSPKQLVVDGFPDLLRGVLQEHGVRPDRLVLEVTESALMDDVRAGTALEALHAIGVNLALDDFGTGYSSLTYLKRFPVGAIKVDRSFVAGLGVDADDEAIVSSVVSLARTIGKVVIAEGVATAAQLDVLRGLDVDYGQGFLWSAPLPLAELEQWLAQGPPVPARLRRTPPAPASAVVTDEGDRARILELHHQGASLHTMAAALNAEGRRTPAGPRWTTKTVARVVAALVPPV